MPNRNEIELFWKKNTKFLSAGCSTPQTSETAPPRLQISGYAPESNHVFALLISMPPEFSLMPRFKTINFYQNKLKIVIFAKKNFFSSDGSSAPRPPNTAPSPHYRFLVTHLMLDVCCSYFHVLESYNEKLLS